MKLRFFFFFLLCGFFFDFFFDFFIFLFLSVLFFLFIAVLENQVQEVGSESAMFRQFFSGWEKDALKLPWADSDPYERSKERIRQLRKEQVVAFLMTQKEAQQVLFFFVF